MFIFSHKSSNRLAIDLLESYNSLIFVIISFLFLKFPSAERKHFFNKSTPINVFGLVNKWVFLNETTVANLVYLINLQMYFVVQKASSLNSTTLLFLFKSSVESYHCIFHVALKNAYGIFFLSVLKRIAGKLSNGNYYL